MKAKSKPIEELTPSGLGVDVAPKLTVTKMSALPARKAGIKVPDVATLVEKLKNEAKAL
jgi:electron transfer flavoprotein beta subunit